MKTIPRLIVHGGAGRKINEQAHRRGVRRAARAGGDVLQKGGSALDAVIAAVVTMEDDPTFNCGTGSALTLAGTVEMDAAVMLDDLRCGAVGGITGVKNPILVARQVMEKTDHVFLVGSGARRFARQQGFKHYNPITRRSQKQWAQMMRQLKVGKNPPYLPHLSSYGVPEKFGTVGAVALDANGRLAAATSTGGIMLHLPGRVGDSPLIGAGTYANRYGAVSATGHGEEIIRIVWAAKAVDLMCRLPAQQAVDRCVRLATRNGCRGGLIALDRRGHLGFGFNTVSMSWAYMDGDEMVVF